MLQKRLAFARQLVPSMRQFATQLVPKAPRPSSTVGGQPANAMPLSRERRVPVSRFTSDVPAPFVGCSGLLASAALYKWGQKGAPDHQPSL